MTTKQEVLDTIHKLTKNINTMIQTVKSLKRLAKHLPDTTTGTEKRLCRGVCNSGKKCSILTDTTDGYCDRHRRQVPYQLTEPYLEALKSVKARPYTHNHGDVEIFHDDCSGCRKKQNEDLLRSVQPDEK